MTPNDVASGVSNCFVFKSRLQEYAQKKKLPTPVYETIKEGPAHKSCFQSTVIVDGVRYNSLPGFFNRKAAEQSAAEAALHQLAKSSELSQCVSPPVHETGLCKNLLQEYAQKMNYAVPMYQCQTSETLGRVPHFTCTVEIGGMKYTGAATRTKKEAEISAGRTALLAIQSESKRNFSNNNNNTEFTVVPCEKRTLEAVAVNETIKTPKAKKPKFKKKARKAKRKVAKDREEIISQLTEHCQTDQSENVIISPQPTEHCGNQSENMIVPPQPTEQCQNHQSENMIITPQPTEQCENLQSENMIITQPREHCQTDQSETMIIPPQPIEHCQADRSENMIIPPQPAEHCPTDQSENMIIPPQSIENQSENMIVPPQPTEHCQTDQSENMIVSQPEHCPTNQSETMIIPPQSTEHCQTDMSENMIVSQPTEHSGNNQSDMIIPQPTEHSQTEQSETIITPPQPTEHCQADQAENMSIPPQPIEHCGNENIETALNPEASSCMTLGTVEAEASQA